VGTGADLVVHAQPSRDLTAVAAGPNVSFMTQPACRTPVRELAAPAQRRGPSSTSSTGPRCSTTCSAERWPSERACRF